jgi:hypothetical protein
LELSESVVNLAKEVDSVSHVLEILISVSQMAVLFNELFHISYRL